MLNSAAKLIEVTHLGYHIYKLNHVKNFNSYHEESLIYTYSYITKQRTKNQGGN